MSNLRWCTYQQNSQNASISSNNSSGIKGVTFDKKSQKWRAQIMIDGIKIYLGLYDTLEEASIARLNKVNQVFGQYANACEGINHGAKPIIKPVILAVVPAEVAAIIDINKILNEIKQLHKKLQEHKNVFNM
jgi:hypothetical protein